MKELNWPEFKAFITARGLTCDYIDLGTRYYIIALDGKISFCCDLRKEQATEFEASYKAAGNQKKSDKEGKEIIRLSNVAIDDNLRVRHVGIFDSVCPANQVTNLTWKIPQLTQSGLARSSFMSGVKYKSVGGQDGDKVHFEVIDQDNILGYGAGIVLDRFAENFPVFPNTVEEIREHQAKLITGLYIRAVFNNSGVNDARFICALLRYVDTKA